jgi:hypothetical protein
LHVALPFLTLLFSCALIADENTITLTGVGGSHV